VLNIHEIFCYFVHTFWKYYVTLFSSLKTEHFDSASDHNNERYICSQPSHVICKKQRELRLVKFMDNDMKHLT